MYFKEFNIRVDLQKRVKCLENHEQKQHALREELKKSSCTVPSSHPEELDTGSHASKVGQDNVNQLKCTAIPVFSGDKTVYES